MGNDGNQPKTNRFNGFKINQLCRIHSTKYGYMSFGQPFIHPSVENKIHQFIAYQLRELGCPVRIINGMPDHIYGLFLLNPQKSIAEIYQIKGEQLAVHPIITFYIIWNCLASRLCSQFCGCANLFFILWMRIIFQLFNGTSSHGPQVKACH